MAKKNFKGGLDSLIENSLGIKPKEKNREKPQTQTSKDDEQEIAENDTVDSNAVSSKEVAALKIEIANLKHELYLWRNGKITPDNFSSTLIKYGLKYNPETNEIEDL